MPNFAQPVESSFVAITIVAIFVVIGIGIVMVKAGKKSRNPES